MNKFLAAAALAAAMMTGTAPVAFAQDALSTAAAQVLAFCLTATTPDLQTECATRMLALPPGQGNLVLAALQAQAPDVVDVANIGLLYSGTGDIGSAF